MVRYHNLPLKQKLILISLMTATIAMLLAGALMFAAEFASYRDSMVRDLTIKAEIIGDQCTAALLFTVRKDAEETLGALRVDPDIESAAVYTGDGALFAQYRRAGQPGRWSPPPQNEGHRFSMDSLTLYQHITLRDKKIGAVSIRSGLRKLHALLLRYVTAAGLALVVALLIAYILVSRLQRTITRPVMDLVQMMQDISQHKDFSVRAADAGEDELGALARGFNDMLSMIQDRDRELEAHRRDLERTVADLERSSDELQKANKKLRDLDKLKSDFISVASHELRTPLTSIKAYVELMLLKPNMPTDRKARLLGIMNSESDRLTRLINDLLDLSRIESGTIAWRLTDISLDDIIRNSLMNIMPLVQNKDQQVVMDIEPGLPLIPGDRDRLVQVVTNILSNAVKFTPQRGGIHVAARRETGPPSGIMVSVADTGIGIPEEDLKVIFDRFQRSGDQLTNTVEGSGLGLAIAREIIEFHGGTIWAESTRGKGSTFTFTLPLDRGEKV